MSQLRLSFVTAFRDRRRSSRYRTGTRRTRPMLRKPYDSQLIPYEFEILELRHTRPATSYARIGQVLNKRHGLQVSRNAIFNFVKVRARWPKIKAQLPEKKTAPSTTAAPSPSGSRHSATRPAATNQSAPTRPHAKPTQVPSRAPTLPGDFIPLKRDQPSTVRKRLKTFTPSAEYNLERLTSQEMELFLKELDEELNANKGG
jgi:hypothetical protein